MMIKRILNSKKMLEITIYAIVSIVYILKILHVYSYSKAMGIIIDLVFVCMVVNLITKYLLYLRNVNYPEYWTHTAYEKFIQGEFTADQALKFCQKANLCKRSDPFGDYVLSILNYEFKEYQIALGHIDAFLESDLYKTYDDDSRGSAIYHKGLILLYLEKYYESIKVIEPLLNSEQFGIESHIIEMWCWFFLKDYKRVLTFCDNLKVESYDKRIESLRVNSLYKIAPLTRLLPYLEECINNGEREYDNTIIYANVVIGDSLQTKYRKAINQLTEVASKAQSKELYDLRSQLYLLTGEEKLAIEDKEISKTYSYDTVIGNNNINNLFEIGCVNSDEIIRFS